MGTIHVLLPKHVNDPNADMRDESGWITTFFDGTDPDTGEHYGFIERRRLVSSVPCIGCTVHRDSPHLAAAKIYEVQVDGDDVEIEYVGCWCDLQESIGMVPWRSCGLGTLATSSVCPRCHGSGSLPTKIKRYDRDCPDCVNGIVASIATEQNHP